MRIGLLADIHANLPALEAAWKALITRGCDLVVNLGDAITIGPFPAETVGFLREHDILCIAGNHEDDLVLGFSPTMEARMGEGERNHYLWTFDQLSADDIAFISGLKHTADLPAGVPAERPARGTIPASDDAQTPRIRCVHYYLSGNRVVDQFVEVDRPTLEASFGVEYDVVAFGHTHRSLILSDSTPLFINPGTAGLHHTGGPTVAFVDVERGSRPEVTMLPVEYDLTPVLAELKNRAVPDHEYIVASFFVGA